MRKFNNFGLLVSAEFKYMKTTSDSEPILHPSPIAAAEIMLKENQVKGEFTLEVIQYNSAFKNVFMRSEKPSAVILPTILESESGQAEWSKFIPQAGEKQLTVNLKLSPKSEWYKCILYIISENRYGIQFIDIQAEKSELQSLERFFTLNLDLLCIANTEGYFLKLNPEWENTLGYSIEELLSTKFLKRVHPEDLPQTEEALSQLRNQKQIIKFVNRYKHKSGEYKSLEWHAQPSGNLIYCAARDITETLEAKNELTINQQYYASIVNTIPDLIFRFDYEGTFLYYHSNDLNLLIMPPEQFMHKKLTDVFKGEYADNTLGFIRECLRTGELQQDEFMFYFNNIENWYEARYQKINTQEVLCIIRNITKRKAAELELIKIQDLLNRTNSFARIGGWELDLKNNTLNWSDTTREILEVGPDYIPEIRNGLDFFKEQKYKDIMQDEVRLAFQNEHTYSVECKIITAKGNEKWIRAQGKSEFKNNKCVRFYGTFQDIDEYKKNQLELADTKMKLESILNEMEDAVYSVSLDNYKTQYITESVYEIYEIPVHEFMEDPERWAQCIHPEDSEIKTLIPKDIQTQGYSDREYRIITPSGKVKWIRDRSKIIYDNILNKSRIDGTVSDISRRKKIEEELINARKIAEAASRTKSEFLANMSHEIRTPLNGVIGFSSLLLHSKMNEEQNNYIKFIHSSAESLMQIIDDILDFSKIEAGKLELEKTPVNLYDLIDQTSDTVKFSIAQKNIEFLIYLDPDLPEIILTDFIRLKQILINLLGNAAKFTHKGEIELSLKLIKSEGKQYFIEFSIRDTGIGLNPETQHKLFQAFTQGDGSTTRKYGGTGLGLSISAMLIEKFNSKIEIKSTEGSGSIFSFILECEGQKENPNKEAHFSRKPKVLLIDDHPVSLRNIHTMLENAGMDVFPAQNFTGAFSLTRNNNFDIIISDYNMPDLNGLELFDALSHNILSPGSKINSGFILLYKPGEEIDVSKLTRPIEFKRLAKPIKRKELLSCLQEINSSRTEEKNNLLADTNGILSSGKNPRIMIVEDVFLNRILLRALLQKLFPSAEIIEAANGQEAVDTYTIELPDIILMDIQMPVKNGYTAAEEIRQIEYQQGLHRTPIIAVTAGAILGEKEKCMEAGMDNFMTKPLELKTLKKILDKYITDSNSKDSGHLPTSDMSVQMQIEQHFDYPFLYEQLNGMEDVIKELVSMGITELGKDILNLKAAVNEEHITEIQQIAHTIKGTAHNLGFRLLGKLAEQTEISAETRLQDCKILTEQMSDELEILRQIQI